MMVLGLSLRQMRRTGKPRRPTRITGQRKLNGAFTKHEAANGDSLFFFERIACGLLLLLLLVEQLENSLPFGFVCYRLKQLAIVPNVLASDEACCRAVHGPSSWSL